MTDYNELVKALRETAKHLDGISRFPYDDDPAKRIYSKKMADAADAIEELQQIADHHEQTARDYWKEACEYKSQLPKLGEWVEDTTTYAGPGLSNYKCLLCGKICGTWRRGLKPSELPNWCGNCGAKMNDSNASNALDNAQDGPIITPCRGCSDYDGYGGCKSKGGCAREKMREVQE